MTPIGLDLSLTSTGISANGLLAIVQTDKTGVQRLVELSEQILKLIAMTTVDPIVIIEGYSFASRNSHAHSIGELGGVVRVALYKENIPIVDVPPTIRAKFATGRGNAGKTEVMSAVSARTGLVFSGKGADDMCDAWILEEIGRTHYGSPRFEWPESHLKALDKIEWR